MADWWDAIPIDLTPEQHADAVTATRAKLARAPVERAASVFWSPFERTLYGFLGEIALAVHLGIDNRIFGAPGPGSDVGTWEAKTSPWAKIDHFHLCQGGKTWIEPRETRRSCGVVQLSIFPAARPRRVWLDGWLPMSAVLDFPLVKSRYSEIRSHVIPYTKLRPARSLPVIA